MTLNYEMERKGNVFVRGLYDKGLFLNSRIKSYVINKHPFEELSLVVLNIGVIFWVFF